MIQIQSLPTARLLLLTFRAFEQQLITELHWHNIHDITLAHLNVIRHINPEGSNLTDLVKDAALSKQAVSKFVQELTHKGYLLVQTDLNDKRAKRVLFSPKGERMIEYATTIVIAIEAEYEKLLGKKNYQQFRTQLQTLYHHHLAQPSTKG